MQRKKAVGVVAQLVEQRTENPCVGGSIPLNTTKLKALFLQGFFYAQSNIHLAEKPIRF